MGLVARLRSGVQWVLFGTSEDFHDAESQVRVLGRGWFVDRVPAGLPGLLDSRPDARRPQGAPERFVSGLDQRGIARNPESGRTGRVMKRVELIKVIEGFDCVFVRHGGKGTGLRVLPENLFKWSWIAIANHDGVGSASSLRSSSVAIGSFGSIASAALHASMACATLPNSRGANPRWS